MSNEWKFFTCTMGENLASIMVDVGISDEIQKIPPNLATVAVTYKQPDERGLPTNVELEAVDALEDRLDAFTKLGEDAYVGRISKEGHRVFFIYTNRAEASWALFVEQLASSTGYALELQLESDPQHSQYWQYLYPTPEDWRVITEVDMLDANEKATSYADIEHTIEHFACFPDEASAKRFVAWATSDGFTHVEEESGWIEDKTYPYRVRLNESSNAVHRDVSWYGTSLRRKAQDFGGDYDGSNSSIVLKK